MEYAIVFNMKSGVSRRMSASEFERLFVGNEQLGLTAKYAKAAANYVAVSPKDGLPLRFSRSYKKQGNEDIVPAHWAKPDGFGNHDHIFGEPEKQNLAKALDAGKAVLLSLNMDLAPQPISYEGIKEKNGQNLIDWIGVNKGRYISIPIHNAQEALDIIRQIKQHDPSIKVAKRVSAVYEGAVVPYHNFYLGTRSNFFSGLYEAMQKGRAGIPLGEGRMIGFPRLIHFVPLDSTKKEKGNRGLKGNHFKSVTGMPQFSQLIFKNEDDKLQTEPYKALRDELVGHPEGIYVLACPSITVVDPKERSPRQWKMMRWVISDIGLQTAAVDPAAKRRLRMKADHDGFEPTHP